MADPVEAQRLFHESMARTERSVMPGIVGVVTREAGRERDADFTAGVGDLVAGEADPGTQSPDAPVLTFAGGGYYFCMPSLPGDEVTGLVSDRTLDEWRESKVPGAAPTFERIKDDSDVMLAPFAITAPPGAPDSWDHPIIGGPLGPAVELHPDNSVMLTKQGAPVATIELDAAGSVTITVETGQSVNLGGAAALALAKAQALTDAVDAMLTAMVSAAAPIVPPSGDGGTAGFVAGQAAWNGLKSAIAALKAKGE